MTPRSAPLAPRGRNFVILMVVLALSALGCGRAVTSSDQGRAPVALALPTSFVAKGATWALFPMGHLGSRPNTFWQLVVERPGSSSWALATPPGVADNGGLVVRAGQAQPLVIGFLTSDLLGFSPLASTADKGATWSGGVLPRALTPVPRSLAGSSAGGSLALLGAGGVSVVSSRGALGSWRVLVTRKALAATPAGSACGIGALTAVATAGEGAGTPVIGSTCTRRGHVGLFEPSGRSWRNVAPDLGRALSSPVTEVAGITASGAALQVLLAAGSGSHSSLVELRQAAPGAPWTTSGRLAIGSGAHLQAIGTAPGGGLFVLLAKGSAASPRDETLEVLGRSSHDWQGVASPPTGTQSVAFAGTSTATSRRLEAFVVDRSTLTVEQLGATSRWSKVQTMHVAIGYGSSS